MIVVGGMVHSSADINNRLEGSDSQRAYDLAAAHMPSITGLSTAVVFKTNDLASTAAVVDEIRALPRIDHVDSPVDHPEQVGPGGISFAAVSFMRTGPPTIEDTAAAIEKIAAAHQSPELQIALGGDPFLNGDVPATEGIGLAAAVVILLIAFGSVVAMGLPIVSALIGIGLVVERAIPLLSARPADRRLHLHRRRDDRARRRDRLRAVHGHPLPNRARRGARGQLRHRSGRAHQWTCASCSRAEQSSSHCSVCC